MAIACAELPVQQWPNLIATLVQNVTDTTASVDLKEQTLEAIGYICQDIVCQIYFFNTLCP
jgi:importin subunit beta-1